MSCRLYISVWNPELATSLLLYTVQFDHMPGYILDDIICIMENSFLYPLLHQKVARLKQTFHELEEYFNGTMTVDIEPHWRYGGMGAGCEQKLINMNQPTIAFDLVGNGVFTKAHVNEVESLQRLRKDLP